MNGDVILVDVQIPDFVEGNPEHLTGQLQVQTAFFLPALFQRPVENGKQLLLVYGLHQIMERRHLVALRDIIGIPGDENDLHRFVFPADALCQRHAVHSVHLDIQKQQIEGLVLRISEQETFGRWKFFRIDGNISFLRPFRDQLSDVFAVRGAVVADRSSVCHNIHLNL